MQKKMIDSKDYEGYRIALPVNFLFGRKRQNYILGELERRHPCFSNQFCFDSKAVISDKKLCADVVVIKKSRIAEYCKVNRNSMFGFSVDGKKNRWFCNKRLVYSCIFFVFLLIVFVSFFFVKMKSFLREKKVGNLVYFENEVTFLGNHEDVLKNNLNGEVRTPSYENFSSGKISKNYDFTLCTNFFETVRKFGGKILSINLSCENGKGTILSELKKMYPENFEELNEKIFFAPLKYENGVPVLNFSGNQKFILRNENLSYGETGFSLSEDSGVFFQEMKFFNEVQIEIRKILMEQKVNIIEEKVFSETSPYVVKFSATDISETFCKIHFFLENRNFFVEKVAVLPEKNGLFYAEISVKKMNQNLCAINLLEIGKNLDLFFCIEKESENNAVSAISNQKKTKYEERKSEGISNLKKIGEVKKTDGSKVVFYKTLDGKTVKKIE